MPTVPDPMLAKAAAKVPEDDRFILEPKYDGWRVLVYVGHNGGAQFYSRSKSRLSRLNNLDPSAFQSVPADSWFDGEVVANEGWGTVQSALTQGSQGAEFDSIKVILFDVLRIAGSDVTALSWSDRRTLLERTRFTGNKVEVTPYGEASQSAHDAMVALGGEGSVAKLKNSRYVYGRADSWVKIKHEVTDEATVVGFQPGKNGLTGRIGALEVEMLDSKVPTTVAGFNENERDDMEANPSRWLGTVIEVKHNGLSPRTGKPRHPRFKRRRDDRSRLTADDKAKREQKKVYGDSGKPGGPKRRNYGAMGDDKLRLCIRELQNGGAAASRALAKGFDPQDDLDIAIGLARGRGIDV